MTPKHALGALEIDDALIEVAAGPFFGPRPVVVTRASDLLRIRFSFSNLRFDTVDDQLVLRRRVANQPALLIVDHPPQHLMERAGLELQDPPIQWPTRPVIAYLGRTSRLVYSVGAATVPWSLPGFLQACATLPLNLPPSARIEPTSRVRFRERGPAIIAAVTTGALRARKVPTGRITAGSAPAVASALASSHRAVAAARQLQHRLGETEAAPALAGLHSAPALGITGLVDEGIDLGPVVIARKPTPARPSATETAVELPWRLALSPGPAARWSHATEPVDHGGRVELWHTRLARLVGDRAVETGQWVRAVWARDFDQFPGGLDPASPTAFLDSDGAADSPRFDSALTSVRRMKLAHETANFQLMRGNSPWEPPAVQVDHLMLTSQGGWLHSSFTASDPPLDNLNITEWRHVATQGRDHFVKVVELGVLLPFGHRSVITTIAERKFVSDDPASAPQPGNPAYVVRRQFITVLERTRSYPSQHKYWDDRLYAGPVPNPQPKRLDLVMPFSSVSILTVNTALLDPHDDPADATIQNAFFPKVGGTAFPFKILATDREGNVLEYSGPLMFVELPLNSAAHMDAVVKKYWDSPDAMRRHTLGGQKVAYAPSTWDGTALSTTKATDALYWDAAHDDSFDLLLPGPPRFAPMLRQAQIVDPAMSALAGKADSIAVKYPSHYTEMGLVDNAAHVFLAVDGAPSTMSFSSRANRSGGLVTPNLDITGFSGSSGPIGGDIAKAVANNPTPADFFTGLGNPKLFGIVPLAELLAGIDVGGFPRFVADQVNRVTTLERDLARVVALAAEIPTRVAALPESGTAEATNLANALQAVAAAAGPILSTLTAYVPGGPLADQLTTLGGSLNALSGAMEAARFVPKALSTETVAVVRRLVEQTEDAATLVGLVDQVARGVTLPESVSASLHWSTQFRAWPPGGATVFQPMTAAGAKAPSTALDLRVQMQAPTTAGKEPTASAVCTLSPFALQLVGDGFFIRLNVLKIEFSMLVGKKVDVSVDFREDNAVEFGGPLSWVNALRDFIPFDGFTDPPYLDVSPSGIKAGFDLALPDIPLGVVNLSNVSLGAQVNVPFIGESLDFRFSFCTRERPFHLTVWVFGGGGFFAITVTPKECTILEAAFEFGAAASVDFGVASGSIEVMAGIYFRLEKGNSELTGYFRLRGEVDVLGLISASIELYLELSYEIDTKTARGRAELTIEIEIAFFSMSVTIECEKKFKGSDQDPTFAEIMGPDAGGDVAASPWAAYCGAFAAA